MSFADERDEQNWQAIVTSGALGLASVSLSPVVILERLPRAAGAIAWFVYRSEDELKSIVSEFHPGSSVSFYFDDRLSHAVYNPKIHSLLVRTIDRLGEVLIGEYHTGDVHLDMQVVSGEDELDEFVATFGSATQVYFGSFPPPDNDGRTALTVTLPDEDGVVRHHPH